MRSQTTIVVAVAIIAVGVILAAALIAGMSSQSQPSPNPTSSLLTQSTPIPTALPTTAQQPQNGPVPKGSDQSAYFSGLLEEQNYVLKQPLSYSINSLGNDVYTGTVARGVVTSNVRIEVCDNIHDTQTRAQDYISSFIAQGYQQRDLQPTYWTGAMANGEAAVVTDTTHLYVMALWY